MFHAFLFNIRNYSPEVINIQWRKVELNIILPRVVNFDIKQKNAWNNCFIICQQQQGRSGKIKDNKTQQILVTTQVFFVKPELQHIWLQLLVNHFILIPLIFFSEFINPWKNQWNSSFPNKWIHNYCRLMQDQARKQDSCLWRYNNWSHRGVQ